MEPMVFARLVQALDIGRQVTFCWSEPGGYGTAILAHLAGSLLLLKGAQLVEKAQALVNNGIDNAVVVDHGLLMVIQKRGPMTA